MTTLSVYVPVVFVDGLVNYKSWKSDSDSNEAFREAVPNWSFPGNMEKKLFDSEVATLTQLLVDKNQKLLVAKSIQIDIENYFWHYIHIEMSEKEKCNTPRSLEYDVIDY